jgi:DNA-binding FrmR family transcriptional regulator
MAHGYAEADHTDRLLARLKRIEGQVRGLQRMIEEDRYCIDVLTQVSSVERALKGVALTMLDDHVRHCVAHAIESGPEAGDDKITEALDVIARLVKS